MLLQALSDCCHQRFALMLDQAVAGQFYSHFYQLRGEVGLGKRCGEVMGREEDSVDEAEDAWEDWLVLLGPKLHREIGTCALRESPTSSQASEARQVFSSASCLSSSRIFCISCSTGSSGTPSKRREPNTLFTENGLSCGCWRTCWRTGCCWRKARAAPTSCWFLLSSSFHPQPTIPSSLCSSELISLRRRTASKTARSRL